MTTTLSSWIIDPVHSSVEFSLDYMGFSTYRTGFRALEGSLEFDPARPASASVNIRPSPSKAPASRPLTWRTGR